MKRHRREMFPLIQLVLFVLPAMVFAGCVTLWHPSAFQTGKVLEKGAVEWEVHSVSYLPSNAGFAVAPLDGLEARISGGLVGDVEGQDILGGEISVTKRVSRTENGSTSASLALEKLGCSRRQFSGIRVSACYAVGIYPSTEVGVHFSWRVSWLNARWSTDESATGFALVPGIGVSFEGNRFAFRMAFNFATPRYIDDAYQLSYLGMQLSLRSPARKSEN